MNKQTPKEAGYTYLWNSKQMYYFLNNDTKQVEQFAVKKDIANWGLKYRNTNLEFCCTQSVGEKLKWIKDLKSIIHWGEQHPSFLEARRLLIKLNEY